MKRLKLTIYCLVFIHFSSVSAQRDLPVPEKEFEIESISPVTIVKLNKGHYFVDFGKAYFGTLEILAKTSQNDSLTIHLGEKLSDQNHIDRNPGGTIRYQRLKLKLHDVDKRVAVSLVADKKNTKKGAIPLPESFGVVMPFRYAEIENLTIPIEKLQINQKVFHYQFNDEASHFASSDTILDSIWRLCKHTIKATTFTGLYVDGDRERIPYEADAYINQLSHYAVDSVYSIARRTNEYFLENPTWPTEWLLHTVMLFYEDYMYTGNTKALEKNYEKLKLKTLFTLERPDGLISSSSEKLTPDMLSELGFKNPKTKIRDIVDWPPDQKDTGWKLKTEAGERDGYEMVPINTVVNAFYYHNTVLMGHIAEALKKDREVTFWKQKSAKVKKAINEKLLDKNSGIYIDGEGSTHSALHANMFPLAFDLVPEEHLGTVINFIKSRGMACSVYGSQFLLEGLFKNGEEHYGLGLVTDTSSDRTWYNMIKIGSTMTLEAWDPAYKPNLDWNHAWGTSPANIIVRYLWGITPKTPGFEIAQIKPRMAHLEHSKIKVPTQKGCILGSFELIDKKQTYELTIPEKMIAEFIPPYNTSKVSINGVLQNIDEKRVILLHSGFTRLIFE